MCLIRYDNIRLSSIIISHFLLKLRRVAVNASEVNESCSLPSTVRFASFIDNMGELLDYGFDDVGVQADHSNDCTGATEDFDLSGPNVSDGEKDDAAAIISTTLESNDNDSQIAAEQVIEMYRADDGFLV